MTPETSPLVPETFGPLQGVKILSSGTIIAQPFAALLAAEMGAEVIQIERPGQGDLVWRNLEFPLEGPGGVKTASAWVQERRNMFHVSLDLSKERGKELSSWNSSPAQTSGWSPPSRGPIAGGASTMLPSSRPTRRSLSATSPATVRAAIPTTWVAPPTTSSAKASAG